MVETLMVVEVVPDRLYKRSEWTGNYRLMPLPDLLGEGVHHTARFLQPYLATPGALKDGKRVACLAPYGVNLLLQRWVFHNSRAAIATSVYDDATSAPYSEAELIEEWCSDRAKLGVGVEDAMNEANRWFSDTGGSGVDRRSLLEQKQHRPRVRKAMRQYLRELAQRA